MTWLLIAICNDHQIENGDINYDSNATPRVEGAIALYSCVSGYQLSGVRFRICADNGNRMGGVWTGSIPSCTGIKTKKSPFPIVCTFLILQQSALISPLPMEWSATVHLLLPDWRGRWLYTAVMRGTDCLLVREQEHVSPTRRGVERKSLANVKIGYIS